MLLDQDEELGPMHGMYGTLEAELEVRKDILIEVEHVKAPRTEKERQHVSLVDKFIAEGSEKADELAQERAMLDGGFMAQARASTIQQEREREHFGRFIIGLLLSDFPFKLCA